MNEDIKWSGELRRWKMTKTFLTRIAACDCLRLFHCQLLSPSSFVTWNLDTSLCPLCHHILSRLCFMMRSRFNAGDDSSRNCIKYLKQRENFGKISFPFLIKNAWNGCRVKYQFRVVDFKIFEQFYWNSLLSFLKVCLLKFFTKFLISTKFQLLLFNKPSNNLPTKS